MAIPTSIILNQKSIRSVLIGNFTLRGALILIVDVLLGSFETAVNVGRAGKAGKTGQAVSFEFWLAILII